jgi:hypothetical protein
MTAPALAHRVAVSTAPPIDARTSHGAAARLRDAVGAVGDGLLLVGIVLCIPFVILAIGVPLALLVRLLLWIARLL